jgi:hypothetical protein
MNIYEKNDWFQEYLDQKGVSLQNHYEIAPLEMKLDIDHTKFIDWANKNLHKATVKDYKPRPFVPVDSLRQSVMTQHLGYNEHNTTEINWGIEPEDDAELKFILGDEAFKQMGLKKDTCLVRLLRYDPGHCIPIHTDSYNGFKTRFGEGNVKRYFVAISPWDWGHFLQVHDNMIHHWEPGYTVEIPNEVFHLSGNCGIAPKYTLTITGFVDE